MRNVTSAMSLLLIIMLLFVFSTCGKGEITGYNAPYGAVVKIGGDTAGSDEATSDTGFCWITEITVEGPMTTGVGTGDGESPTVETQPLSNIQVQVGGGYVRIYTPAEGSDYITAAEEGIEHTEFPFFVKTNSRGFYQVVVCAMGPADTGLTEVNAWMYANIGVGTAEFKMKIKAPE